MEGESPPPITPAAKIKKTPQTDPNKRPCVRRTKPVQPEDDANEGKDLEKIAKDNDERAARSQKESDKRQAVADRNVVLIRDLAKELPDLQPAAGFTAKLLGCGIDHDKILAILCIAGCTAACLRMYCHLEIWKLG